jgi:UDP-N-acetylglucosamine 2-epimerase (non-hydrolysing)
MRVAVVVGTRPEAIKMAPVIHRLKREPTLDVKVVASGQHREMLNQVLDIFGIAVDHDLAVMRPDQTLSSLTTAVIDAFDARLGALAPGWVLVHGDTTTAMAASLAAFHRGIPVGHVESGLRTGDLSRPFPEEFNRRCIDTVATLLWAPTSGSRANLIGEGLPTGKRIVVTGNTAIDALVWASKRIASTDVLRRGLAARFPFLDGGRRLVLVTGHRRESFGDGFLHICEALRELSRRSDVQVVYPVHLNPNVMKPVHAILGGIGNVHLIEPQDYLAFVHLMGRADVILTDSGGIQEEGPSLGKPVLVMRDVTERPEAIAAGTARLVGANRARIVEEVSLLLDDADARQRMAGTRNPYGDGQASDRIVRSLIDPSACFQEWDG